MADRYDTSFFFTIPFEIPAEDACVFYMRWSNLAVHGRLILSTFFFPEDSDLSITCPWKKIYIRAVGVSPGKAEFTLLKNTRAEKILRCLFFFFSSCLTSSLSLLLPIYLADWLTDLTLLDEYLIVSYFCLTRYECNWGARRWKTLNVSTVRAPWDGKWEVRLPRCPGAYCVWWVYLYVCCISYFSARIDLRWIRWYTSLPVLLGAYGLTYIYQLTCL